MTLLPSTSRDRGGGDLRAHSGYVRERYVDIGDRVAAATPAQIDTPELDQSSARPARSPDALGLARPRELHAGAGT